MFIFITSTCLPKKKQKKQLKYILSLLVGQSKKAKCVCGQKFQNTLCAASHPVSVLNFLVLHLTIPTPFDHGRFSLPHCGRLNERLTERVACVSLSVLSRFSRSVCWLLFISAAQSDIHRHRVTVIYVIATEVLWERK